MSAPLAAEKLEELRRLLAYQREIGRDYLESPVHLDDLDALVAEVERLRRYEWAIEQLEGLVDRHGEDREDYETDPPWRFAMFVGDDGDTIDVEGRTLLHALLAYYEQVEPDPAEPDQPAELDQIRTRLRDLIADRTARINAEGEAFLARLRAADAARGEG